MQAAQDVRIGGRTSAAQYQFTMRGDNVQDLISYAPAMFQQLKTIPIISDLNSDQQNKGLQASVTYDRKTAARFNISPQLIDDTLYDAFGQRQASVMYTSLNQYHVVMVVQPQYWQNLQFLDLSYVRAPNGQQIPLSTFSKFSPAVAQLSVSHQGLFPASRLATS